MKKIISLGIAAAVCAVTAISASAAEATTLKVASGEVKEGEKVTIELVANEDLGAFDFVVETSGLAPLTAADFKANGMFSYNETTKKGAVVVSTGSLSAKAGDVACTITATVTAKAGEKVSIKLTGAKVPAAALEVEVKGAVTSEPDNSKTESDTSKTESDTSKEESKTESDTSKGDKPGDVTTGVALAVVPAVLAAAGVVVAKKRK